MWGAALEVMLCDHFTQASLLLYKMVGEEILLRVWPLSETLHERFQKSTTFFKVALVAGIATSDRLRRSFDGL
jgi:hypothetical protein